MRVDHSIGEFSPRIIPRLRRRQFQYAGLALLTVALGLLLQRTRGALPAALADKLGDALWAAMMYWWVSAALPGASVRARALTALGIAWAVEASQALRPPWLDAVRATRLGHLVLGSDFDARDLVAYAAGVAVPALGELGVRRWWTRRGSSRRGNGGRR